MSDAARTTGARRAGAKPPWLRRTRWASLAGLLWLTGCLDLCSGTYESMAANRALRAHEYASAEAVWPHVRDALARERVPSVPDAPPATSEWLTLPPTAGRFVERTYRVRLERVSDGPAVRLEVESSRSDAQMFQSTYDVELDVLRAADPAAAATIEQRRAAGGRRVDRGCDAGFQAGCGLVNACLKPGAQAPAE